MKKIYIYMAEMVKLVCWYVISHSALATLTHLLILFARLPDLHAKSAQYQRSEYTVALKKFTIL